MVGDIDDGWFVTPSGVRGFESHLLRFQQQPEAFVDDIERIKNELSKPHEGWLIDFESYSPGSIEATVFVPMSNGFRYEVVTMEEVPLVGSGDDESIDYESRRAAELLLLTSAPDLLRAVRKAIVELESITKANEVARDPMLEHGVEPALWMNLASIQSQLMIAELAATDTGNL